MSRERAGGTDDAEDLSVLARRAQLSAADQRAFAEALAGSATLRAAHQVGLDFDAVANVAAGDDALIAEVATRVLRVAPRPTARSLRLRLLAVAAALLVAGSAAAIWRPWAIATDQAAPKSPGSALAIATAPRLPPAKSALPASPSVTPSSTPPRVTHAASDAIHPSGSARAADSASGGLDTAEALFREANAARHTGENAIARALYLRLEREFPASEQARLAHVSLGNLLLGMGRAAEAEAQFAAYPDHDSALSQEALVGRAQSLAVLGRTLDEERVWRSLLRSFPGSVYATRAEQRLTELGRAGAHAE